MSQAYIVKARNMETVDGVKQFDISLKENGLDPSDLEAGKTVMDQQGNYHRIVEVQSTNNINARSGVNDIVTLIVA